MSMPPTFFYFCVFLSTWFCWFPLSLSGATALQEQLVEIHLHSSARCSGSVVTLGEIARIRSADPTVADQLSNVKLFPSPTGSQSKTATLREIEELLALRSVDTTHLRFSGSSRIRIQRADANLTSQAMDLPEDTRGAIREEVEEAIIQYLRAVAGDHGKWTAEPRLTADDYRRIAQADSFAIHSGGRAPWSGIHDFRVDLSGTAGGDTVIVKANISRTTMVVTASRPVRKGQIIRAADLRIGPAPPRASLADYVYEAERLVGKEAMRSFATGQAISQKAIRSPLLVRRNQIVTVYSRVAGVKVTTQARALDSGSRGDTVAVQALSRRDRYMARVVDVQEVAVFADPPRVHAERESEAEAELKQAYQARRQARLARLRTVSSNIERATSSEPH